MAYSAYFEVEPAARSGGICRGRVVLTDESAARRGVEPEEFGAGAACAPSSASAVETDNAAVAGGASGESDAVGAFPIHAVTVANTEDAIVMSGMLLEARPQLLTQVHALHRAGFPLFTGESSLHICCVNKRVDLLNKMIDLAATKLTKEEAGLWGQRFDVPHYHGYTNDMQKEACDEYAKHAYKLCHK